MMEKVTQLRRFLPILEGEVEIDDERMIQFAHRIQLTKYHRNARAMFHDFRLHSSFQ